MNNGSISIHRLEGFSDPLIDHDIWQRLLSGSRTNTIFQTLWWQKAWWEVFGRGQMILLGVFRHNRLVGLAPFFSEEGMIFFTASGGSDYLDFIGEIPDQSVMADLLDRAIKLVPGFVGFRFYHVPESSVTGKELRLASAQLGMVICNEGEDPAPCIDLSAVGEEVTRKKSLIRHHRFFEREGNLSVQHFNRPQDVLPRLEFFFEQHIRRWEATPYPSLFLDLSHCRFYEALVKSSEYIPWLRFTEVCWDDKPIAYHFGFSYGGTYMWYKPSFDVQLAKRSPGEVLIRSLLLAAIDEGAIIFDLGMGSEVFKERFATDVPTVRTWGIYPSSKCNIENNLVDG